jgi:phosphoglucosamine mutase
MRAIEAASQKLGASGRLVIRPSGTEPVIRVMAEGDDRALVEGVVDDVIGALSASAA